MTTLVLCLILTLIFIYSVVLLKTYKNLPAKELKRQARKGDKLADSLYKVVGFGKILDITLWFVIGLSGGLLFALLSDNSSLLIAVFVITLMIWFGFAWLPNSYSSLTGRKIASYSAKPLHVILDFLYPVLVRVERLVLKFLPINIHTGLYNKQDLISLLKAQKGQLDNRISKDDLEIAQNSLLFGDKLVREVMTPRRVMKTIDVNESVGPITMEELHKSGHSRFPVFKDKKDNFVGILYMRDMLKARSGGKVAELMDSKVYFVHDESRLSEVLQAFIKTYHHLFLVVNSFEEVVGLISMEDILEQILDKPILDEFDQYDSMRAVASKLAIKEHKLQKEPVSIKAKV